MSPRYILLVAPATTERVNFVRAVCEANAFDLTVDNEQFSLCANAACRCIPVGNSGCILGSLFRRDGPAEQVSSFSAPETRSIVESDGQALLSSFWGAYAALVTGPNIIRTLRDPSGAFPCYYLRSSGFTIFASDAELLASCVSGPICVDFEEIGRQLVRSFVPSASTSLRGIRELLPGFALRHPMENDNQEQCWSPWDHVVGSIDDRESCHERLGHVVRDCVSAWASNQKRLLLSVSGGLDSSIIAASLAKAVADTVCLTMYTDDPMGDERAYARALCEHLGLPLVERQYRLQDIDITEPLAPHLPRPRDRTQANAYERVNLEVAQEVGADCFMTGNGGDSVFGYSQSAAPIADRFIAQGLKSELFGSLFDVCRQTGCSLTDALRQAWRMTRDLPNYRVRPRTPLISAQFIHASRAEDFHHPWLDAPPDALPGKAAHVASILRAQPTIEAARGYYWPMITPLISQPIVEICLGIPSWSWRAGGQDRAVARCAFAGQLPALVLDRRVKGSPSGFAAKILDHFRGPIRERLLGGKLAAHGIVDTVALEQILAGETPIPVIERERVLELVNAEAWIDHWLARARVFERTEAFIMPASDVQHLVSGDPIP